MKIERAYELLIKKLHDFSLPLNLIEEEHERRIITAVARKLSQLSEECLLRVYKVDRVDNKYILRLLAHSGIRRGSVPEIIAIDDINRKGPLSWCLDRGEESSGFWVEDIKTTPDLSKLVNRFDEEEIGSDYIDFVDDPDTIVAIPLKTAQNNIIGVISVQFKESFKPAKKFVDVLLEISIEISRIIRKSSETSSYIRNSTDAVEGFLDDLMQLELSPSILEEREPIGFVARPFDSSSNRIGKEIEEYLREQSIEISTYDPDRGGGIVPEDLVTQIRDCLFGVADITGSNPNVLMEVGVMISVEKKVILLKDYKDSDEIPFNVSNYYVHRYRISEKGTLEVKPPQGTQFKPFNEIMDAFLGQFRR